MIQCRNNQNLTVYIAPLANWSGECTIWWEIIEELLAKCISMGLKEHNKHFLTLVLNLVTLGAAMELWEAVLSSSALANAEPNRTCSYRNL